MRPRILDSASPLPRGKRTERRDRWERVGASCLRKAVPCSGAHRLWRGCVAAAGNDDWVVLGRRAPRRAGRSRGERPADKAFEKARWMLEARYERS